MGSPLSMGSIIVNNFSQQFCGKCASPRMERKSASWGYTPSPEFLFSLGIVVTLPLLSFGRGHPKQTVAW